MIDGLFVGGFRAIALPILYPPVIPFCRYWETVVTVTLQGFLRHLKDKGVECESVCHHRPSLIFCLQCDMNRHTLSVIK